MKTIKHISLLVPVMTFAGCSKGNDEPQAETPDTPDNPGDNEDNNDGSGTVKPGNGKILIAWFSRCTDFIFRKTYALRK